MDSGLDPPGTEAREALRAVSPADGDWLPAVFGLPGNLPEIVGTGEE